MELYIGRPWIEGKVRKKEKKRLTTEQQNFTAGLVETPREREQQTHL